MNVGDRVRIADLDDPYAVTTGGVKLSGQEGTVIEVCGGEFGFVVDVDGEHEDDQYMFSAEELEVIK